jgi:hypothetical protein
MAYFPPRDQCENSGIRGAGPLRELLADLSVQKLIEYVICEALRPRGIICVLELSLKFQASRLSQLHAK